MTGTNDDWSKKKPQPLRKKKKKKKAQFPRKKRTER